MGFEHTCTFVEQGLQVTHVFDKVEEEDAVKQPRSEGQMGTISPQVRMVRNVDAHPECRIGRTVVIQPASQIQHLGTRRNIVLHEPRLVLPPYEGLDPHGIDDLEASANLRFAGLRQMDQESPSGELLDLLFA